jgi:hypothetical protein
MNINKHLIYFTLNNNINYIKLAKLCISSLYNAGYNGDFLFITNFENEILSNINFLNAPKFLNLGDQKLIHSSANKLKIFLYKDINKYDKIIFSDTDILWLKNPNTLFELINQNKFYVSNEKSLMSDKWWGGDILSDIEKIHIKNNNIFGINAGIFGFSSSMIDYIKNIDIFMNHNFHLVNTCLEQPFLNVYLYRNDLYNNSFTSYISHDGYDNNKYSGTALHFAGGPGNFNIKYDKMLSYIKNNNLL